jgi:hypothetical protein
VIGAGLAKLIVASHVEQVAAGTSIVIRGDRDDERY